MDIISFILSLALEKGSDSPSASSVTYDPSTSVGLISTDVQDAIDELSTRGGLKNEIVQSLPLTGEEGICYFVPNNSSEVENIYDEYVWFDSLNDYEKIGSTKVDISDLLKSEAITVPYDDTQTYAVGDYVTYLGYLYRCKTAVTTAQSFAPAKWDKIDLFTYIKNDGADYLVNTKTYNSLTTTSKTISGAINEITGYVGSDNAPYVFRQVPYHARQCNMRTLIGGSVVWNQLVKNGNFEDTSEWATTNGTRTVANNVLIFTPSAQYGNVRQDRSDVLQKGHIYMYSFDYKTEANSSYVAKIGNAGYSLLSMTLPTASNFTRVNKIGQIASTTSYAINSIFIIQCISNSDFASIDVKNVNVIDITAEFGTTISNYIYTLEQNTSGSGVAWFRKYFPEVYYAYSAPTIQSTKVSSKVVKDSDNQTVATYDLSGSHLVKRKYAEDDMGDFLWQKGSGYFYTTSLAPTISKNQPIQCTAFINATSGDGRIANDTSGNLIVVASSYDSMTREQFKTAMSGQKIVYPLATPTTETVTNPTLYGIWKLDANNNLYFDGDEIEDFVNVEVVGYDGTEEFIDAEVVAQNRDVSLPCGHNTDYFNSNVMEYNIDYTDDKCDELKDYIDAQIQQNITSVLNASY